MSALTDFLRRYLLWIGSVLLLLGGVYVWQVLAKEEADLDMSGLDMSRLDMSTMPTVDGSQLKMKPAQKDGQLYRCPMHPQVVQDHPGNCPICGMNLEKVEQAEQSDKALSDNSALTGSRSNEKAQGSLQDRAAIKINPTRQQLIGVKTARITRKPVHQELRTVARVEPNGEQYAHVHTKYEGWIEKLYVSFIGQQVKAGQPLFRLYSPELVVAQREYLSAKAAVEALQTEPLFNTQATALRLLDAAEEKLKLYDLTAAQIDELERTGVPQRSLTVFAQHIGVVTQIHAVEGMRVTAGLPLYTLANLDTIWVQGKVYESDIARVRVEQTARIELPFLPGESFRGQVSYIDPVLNAQTRTANVRVALANPHQTLKPNMFAHMTLEIQAPGRLLMVPAAAVIDTGQQQFVFVVGSGGTFRPTSVKVGTRMGSDYVLLEGPEQGTTVLTDAQFLVDSESQLQAVIQHMTPTRGTGTSTPGASAHVH